MIDQKWNEPIGEMEVADTILRYGADILKSDVFRKAADETHHLHGTVLDHTINVCVASLKLSRFFKKRGVKVNERDLIRAALCHDLGMVGREEKYRHRVDSWGKHPKESVRIARSLLPDLSEKEEEMIRNHMWPAGGSLPGSNEAKILSLADKYASMADWQSWITKRRYAARIKERLEAYMERESEENGD